MDLQNGTIVNGHYRIVGSAPIGRGGFSEVWKAVDVMTGVEVVLKIYAPGTGLDAEGLEVLKREFALVFQLNHNNLLKATHFDIIEGKIPFLVMPYCPGSCADVRQAFPEREVFRFLRDVAAGLEFLHERDIVHQDIKPANILIDASGQYVITDFGISTRVRNTLRKSATQQKSSEGTIAYMAPERFGRDNMPVKASDVWSLGVTVFELIAGYVPFGEHGGLMQKNGAEIPEIPGDYSPELKMLVTACLAPQPWNRPLASQIREYAGYGLQGQNQKIAEALQGKVTTAGETAAAPKKRNKFISFWLGLMITLNTLGACFMLYGLLTEDMYGGDLDDGKYVFYAECLMCSDVVEMDALGVLVVYFFGGICHGRRSYFSSVRHVTDFSGWSDRALHFIWNSEFKKERYTCVETDGLFFPLERAQGDVRGIYRSFGRNFSDRDCKNAAGAYLYGIF